MNRSELLTRYYDLDFKLVDLATGKRPLGEGWQDKPISAGDPGRNIGLNHYYSGTAALDLDHEGAYAALAAVGIDLAAVLDSARYKIVGNPAKPPKPLFRVPAGISLKRRALAWPDPTGKLNQNGQPALVTIFEIRGGHGFQDVLPPSIHPDTHRPYTWLNGDVPGSRDDIPELPAALLELWQNWDRYEPAVKAACPWYTQPDPDPAPTPRRAASHSDDVNVSEVQAAFNARYTVGDVLEPYGYEKHGRKWLAPNSSTKTPGVLLLKDSGPSGKVISFHGSDVLADGKPHDAYDCYVILKHAGDKSAAWHAARRELGLEPPRPEPRPKAPGLSAKERQAVKAAYWALPEVAEQVEEAGAARSELVTQGQRVVTVLDDLAKAKNGHATPAYSFDIPFELDSYSGIDADTYRTEIVPARKSFKGARAWRDHIIAHRPDLDPLEEYRRKRVEDKRWLRHHCGMTIHYRGGAGQWYTRHITCGECDYCKGRIRENLRGKLAEVISQSPGLCLSQITVKGKKAQAKVTRVLGKKNFKCFPLEGDQYQILTTGADTEARRTRLIKLLMGLKLPIEFLDIIDLTDARLSAWIDTPAGKRASGALIGEFKRLSAHEPDDDLEIDRRHVYVEMELAGHQKRVPLSRVDYWLGRGWTRLTQRVDRTKIDRLAGLADDPEVVSIEVCGMATQDKQPPKVAPIDREVTSAAELQTALVDGHKLACNELRRRGGVILCIVSFKKYYVLNDIPELCARFNAEQARIREAKKPKV